MTMYKCPICNKEFYDLDNLVEHIKYCADKKKKSDDERRQKLNADINRVKSAEKYFNEQLDKFKKEYPEEFKINFPQYTKASSDDNCHCGDSCKCNKDINKSDVDAKKTYEEEWDKMKSDPFIQNLLDIFGIAY